MDKKQNMCSKLKIIQQYKLEIYFGKETNHVCVTKYTYVLSLSFLCFQFVILLMFTFLVPEVKDRSFEEISGKQDDEVEAPKA